MRHMQRRRLESYIKLLRLFESHLKVYHKLFNNDFYTVNYIIQRERYTNEVNVKLIFTILRAPFWKLVIGEQENIRNILENYCRYFSVTDITIVRALILQNKDEAKKSSIFQKLPLEDRVSFDLNAHEETWRPINLI
jgi:hypothetical protein